MSIIGRLAPEEPKLVPKGMYTAILTIDGEEATAHTPRDYQNSNGNWGNHFALKVIGGNGDMKSSYSTLESLAQEFVRAFKIDNGHQPAMTAVEGHLKGQGYVVTALSAK